jgi:pimeloyl-ACP methyl ester carboxylesterase
MAVTLGTRIMVDTAGFAGPVHVREDGRPDAPPIVLLHGFSGSMHWYDLVVPLLADAFRIIRVDLLGHGSTGGPAVDAPVQARMVEAVLGTLDVAGATAVGHSFGADIAVELAERSDRVARLVIVAQAPDYSDATLPRGSTLIARPLASAVLGRVFQGLAMAVGGALALRRAPSAGRVLAAQALRDFRALDLKMFGVVLVERRDRMARRPLDAQVRDAQKPTLVILGERDHFYGARSQPRYDAAGAQVHVLTECGHSPLVERPTETAQLIRTFLADG